MPLTVNVTTQDNATPFLKQMAAKFTGDRTEWHGEIAKDATVLTQDHVRALNIHETAQRLGAAPSSPGYFEKKANQMVPAADSTRAMVMLNTGLGLEAFARVFGDVTVNAINSKYLTIPANAAAYGRRAGSFEDLKFIPFGNGVRALVKQTITMVPGKRKAEIKKIENEVFYWLKPSVVLPQDDSLLPTAEQYGKVAETATERFIDELETEEAALTA
jgi:hypothetical protein